MNSLEKYRIEYEYNQSHRDVKKFISQLHKINKQRLMTIRKLARQGTPLKDLAKTYDMTVQKISSIIRSK